MWQLCAPMMSWVDCLLKYSELFILFAEKIQILLKISVIPIHLTFIYLVALNLLVNNQLNSSSNSSLRHIIVTIVCSIVLFWNSALINYTLRMIDKSWTSSKTSYTIEQAIRSLKLLLLEFKKWIWPSKFWDCCHSFWSY